MAEGDGSGVTCGPIKGASEARKVLLAVPQDMADRLPKDARGVGAQVAAEVTAAFPSFVAYSVPDAKGKSTLHAYDINPQVSVDGDDSPVGSVSERGEQVPLFRIVVEGTNATFADMGTEQVNAGNRNRVAALDALDSQAGGPSRFAWPVAHRARARVNAIIDRAAKKAQQDYTNRLASPKD